MAVLPFNSTHKCNLRLKMAGGGRYTDGSNAIRKMSKVGRNGYGMRCGKTDGGMNPLNSSSPSISIPQIICNHCHAQRAHRRSNAIFLMDFQDECESDGMDTTEALLVFFFCMNVLWLFKQVNFMQMWSLLAMAEFTNSRRRKGQTNTVERFSTAWLLQL